MTIDETIEQLRWILRALADELVRLRARVAELERDLPDWEDLRGRAPDATGDLSSEEFVRRSRERWSK